MNLRYITKVKMKEQVTKEMIVDYINQWLIDRKDRNYGLQIPDEIPYSTQKNNITLELMDYPSSKILTFHYIFKDPKPDMSYGVDLIYLYSKKKHYLYMLFYMGIGSEGTYHNNFALPGLFRNILFSKEVYSDYGFNYCYPKKIPSAHFSLKDLEKNYDLPLIYLKKQNRSLFNKIMGNAHIVLLDNMEEDEIKVRFPDHRIQNYPNTPESRLLIISEINEYCIQSFYDPHYTIRELRKEEIRKKYYCSLVHQNSSLTKEDLKNNLLILEALIKETEEEIEELELLNMIGDGEE